MFPTYTIGPRNIPPSRNGPNRLFSKGGCLWVFRRSTKRKNGIGKARWDAGNDFSHFVCILPKIQYAKCTNMDYCRPLRRYLIQLARTYKHHHNKPHNALWVHMRLVSREKPGFGFNQIRWSVSFVMDLNWIRIFKILLNWIWIRKSCFEIFRNF